jgi:TnpA family transposase
LYHALKAFGQILKSIFILRVIDEPVLRMSIEKVLSGIEHVHAFTRAVSVGNPREFLQAEKEDQEMAEVCKRLIKNCIICWNYLYLSQKGSAHETEKIVRLGLPRIIRLKENAPELDYSSFYGKTGTGRPTAL